MFCERCGAPFSVQVVKIKRKKEIKENLISKENEKRAKKILIGIFLLNFFLIIYFLSFTPIGFIRINQLNFIGVLIFIFILFFGILEIIRGLKLFRNKVDEDQILMVDTIGHVLLRKVLYSPSKKENIKSSKNEVEALKILILMMYVNFILANYYYSTTLHLMRFVYDISLFLFIYSFIEIFHLSIAFIILFKVKLLKYRFLRVSALVQLIFFNFIFILVFNSPLTMQLHILLLLLLDATTIYVIVKIIKSKKVLMQYFPQKGYICNKCGSRMKNGDDYCPKCLKIISKSEIDLEGVPLRKIERSLSSYEEISEPEEIVGKRPEPEEISDGVDSKDIEELGFLKDEKEKELIGNYLLERFVVVSEQLRILFNKLNLSREEKIDLLKDFSFLTYKEQKNLLDLLVHLCND